MDTKIPDQPVENLDDKQLDFVAQEAKPPVDLSGCKTKEEKVKALRAAGHHTSKPQGAAVDATSITDAVQGVTVQNKAYIEGKLENIVDPQNTWIINANQAKAPLKAGISGTTARFVGAAAMLGGKKNGAVCAMIGHLQKIEAHSFWEIVEGAQLGMPAGKYIPFPPNPGGMEAAGTQFIEQNGFAELGPIDKEHARKLLLLGEDK